eukprot:TRINITY_DN19399_c0_g1_i2.p1 TRINITY_DN19399_c0_g1~~TRINITY_DN19399_c0_g1_i2.p1  ORF type:complete len:814 (-),score=170.43 TRINITY_DN19399_c0_g1_i2:46-2295(-)
MAAKVQDAMRESSQSLGNADAGRLRPPVLPYQLRMQNAGCSSSSQADAGIQHPSLSQSAQGLPLSAANHFGPVTHCRLRQAPAAASAPSLLRPDSEKGILPHELQAACAAHGTTMALPACAPPTQNAFSRHCGGGFRRPTSAGPQRQTSPSCSPVNAFVQRQASPSPLRPASAGLQRHAHMSSSAGSLVHVKSATLTSLAAAMQTPVGSYLKLLGLSKYADYFVDLGLVSLDSISGQSDEELLHTLERVPLFPGHKARLLRGAQVLREASLVGVRQQSSRVREEQTLIQLCHRNDELCQQYLELEGQANSLRQQNGALSAELSQERSRVAELECLVRTQAEQVGFLAEQLQRILVDGALPAVHADASTERRGSAASTSEAAAVGMVYDSNQATAPAIFSVARPHVPPLPLSSSEPQTTTILQTLPENDDNESADEEQHSTQPQHLQPPEEGAKDSGFGAEEPGASENRRIVEALRRKQDWQPEQKIGEREKELQAQVIELNRRLAEAEAAAKGAAAGASATATCAPTSARSDRRCEDDESIATSMALAIKKKLEEPGTAQTTEPMGDAEDAEVFSGPGTLSRVPDHFEIAEFLLGLFRSIDLSSLAAVLALAYLERFTQRSGVLLCPRNWQRLSVTATLLASMVWDRDTRDSSDFAEVLPLYSEYEIQKFHRAFLCSVGGDLLLSPRDFHEALSLLQGSSAERSHPGSSALALPGADEEGFGERLQERSTALQAGMVKAAMSRSRGIAY